MKYCCYCGTGISEDAKYCSKCGAAVMSAQNVCSNSHTYEENEQMRAAEQKCLDELSAKMKHESLTFLIVGLVILVVSVVLVISGGLMGETVLSMQNGYYYYYDQTVLELYNFLGGIFVYGGFGYAAIGVFNLIYAKRLRRYASVIYTDCTSAVNQAGSVGTIVLGALFNNIALIFIIINFIYVNKNKDVFHRIKQNQQNYNNFRL